MKRLIVSAFVVATAIATTSAGAADLGRGRAPAYTLNSPVNMYSWAGFYIGGNVGYQWGRIYGDPTRPSGVLGGLQAGYNWQSGGLVFGGEIDAQVTAANDVFATWKFANPWFGTARGRVGYAFNNFLLYGTAGLAFGALRGESLPLVELRGTWGWTAGLGAEFGFAPNWSAKVEYLYVDLANQAFSITGIGTSNGYGFNVLRLGVNYHF